MELAVHRWGDGPRTAVLLHGYSDDASTWWRIAETLAARGWTVLAPDLAGHGWSPRRETYGVALLAADVVASVPSRPDLLLGHSLGAAVADLAADALVPARLVLVDPPWGTPPAGLERSPAALTSAQVRDGNPRWCDRDVAADVRSSALLDPSVTHWIAQVAGPDLPRPRRPVVPTTVVVPDVDALVPPGLHPHLAQLGIVVHVVEGAGHVVHRDAPRLLLDLLDGVQDDRSDGPRTVPGAAGPAPTVRPRRRAGAPA